MPPKKCICVAHALLTVTPSCWLQNYGHNRRPVWENSEADLPHLSVPHSEIWEKNEITGMKVGQALWWESTSKIGHTGIMISTVVQSLYVTWPVETAMPISQQKPRPVPPVPQKIVCFSKTCDPHISLGSFSRGILSPFSVFLCLLYMMFRDHFSVTPWGSPLSKWHQLPHVPWSRRQLLLNWMHWLQVT